jgi:hypothetical protein
MGVFVTVEAAREQFRALSDQVDAAHAEMRALSSDGVGNAFRVEMAERWETQERTNRALMCRMFGEIADPPMRPRWSRKWRTAWRCGCGSRRVR